MIKDNMTPYAYKVTFKDSGVKRTNYTDTKKYYEELVALHGHLTDLTFTQVSLNVDQQSRLDEISEEGLTGAEASLYVQYGTVGDPDSAFFDSIKYEKVLQDSVEPKIKAARVDAEASPVYLNGIPYSGDPSNRQALQEALMAAEDSSITHFDSWKDSEGVYHDDHPVEDVRNALRKIGQRRSELITKEALYVKQVASGDMDSFELDWSTSFDSPV